ncbi:MAG: hypothetical protein ACP5MC_01980 [Candidatus Micrarchaeia archaeon]
MTTSLEIPQGVKIEIDQSGTSIKISGKLGSTVKHANPALLSISLKENKLEIETTDNKKRQNKAKLAEQALSSEIKAAMEGVQNGITRHMRVIYSHFPISFEIKENKVFAKNFFGEHLPRVAKIIGDTKVEIKGQDVIVTGVDPYDVGQTVANLFKLSFQRNKDPRIFQDGIYLVREE